MVALVVSSMGTVGNIIGKILGIRQGYFHFKFQESSILLFLEMCEPTGHVQVLPEKLKTLSVENIGFTYQNLAAYEKKYMDMVKEFIKHGKTGKKWIDEAFDALIKGIEDDIGKSMPKVLDELSVHFEVGKIYGIV